MAEQNETEAEVKPEPTPEPIRLDPVRHDSVLGSGAPDKNGDDE